MSKATVVAAAAAFVLAGQANAARFAIGFTPGVSLPTAAAQLRSFGSVSFELGRLHALIVETQSVRGVKRIDGVRWVEWLGSRRRRLVFTPTDPLVTRQWYLEQDHAFDFWPFPPVLPPVKVALIDSGIDMTHPDLAPKILIARSFVGGSANDVN